MYYLVSECQSISVKVALSASSVRKVCVGTRPLLDQKKSRYWQTFGGIVIDAFAIKTYVVNTAGIDGYVFNAIVIDVNVIDDNRVDVYVIDDYLIAVFVVDVYAKIVCVIAVFLVDVYAINACVIAVFLVGRIQFYIIDI